MTVPTYGTIDNISWDSNEDKDLTEPYRSRHRSESVLSQMNKMLLVDPGTRYNGGMKRAGKSSDERRYMEALFVVTIWR